MMVAAVLLGTGVGLMGLRSALHTNTGVSIWTHPRGHDARADLEATGRCFHVLSADVEQTGM